MTTKAEHTTEKVTQKLETGNHEVLDELRKMVLRFNGSADPDLEQDAFISVLAAFRRRKTVQSPRALMRKIVRDTVVDAWRRKRRLPWVPIAQIPDAHLSEEPRSEEVMDRQRAHEQLRDAIFQLGCDTRGPVYLFYVESYPIRTLARIFGKSPSAIKMTLYRGRAQLGHMLPKTGRSRNNKVAGAASSSR